MGRSQSLRTAASDLDTEAQGVLKQFTIGQIREGNGYAPDYRPALRDFGISEAEGKSIHLDAMELISPSEETRLKAKTDEQKRAYKETRKKVAEKLKIRREHLNEAKAFGGSFR